MEKHKIARLVISGKYFDQHGNPKENKLQELFEKFVAKTHKNQHFEFLVTPGGFLTFEFPKTLPDGITHEAIGRKHLSELQREAEKAIKEFLGGVKPATYRKLKSIADYLTIGLDGNDGDRTRHRTELVGVYDLKKDRVKHWTGKFYPTERQKGNLVRVEDINSHFVRLNGKNVVILGCHDLNVYNPRGQAAANPGSWKRKIATKFKTRCKRFNPDIILQHPHTTDTPNIWNLAWKTVEKELPGVETYASGINFHNWETGPRGDLQAVLEKSRKGDVVDFYFFRK